MLFLPWSRMASPEPATMLSRVRDIGLATASDDEIVEFAALEGRVVVSADTDFATILALRRAVRPSFVLLRVEIERRTESQTTLLVAQLPALEQHLISGAVIVITRNRIRIRSLPILSV